MEQLFIGGLGTSEILLIVVVLLLLYVGFLIYNCRILLGVV